MLFYVLDWKFDHPIFLVWKEQTYEKYLRTFKVFVLIFKDVQIKNAKNGLFMIYFEILKM